jgi:predicted ATPase with chaperone activity
MLLMIGPPGSGVARTLADMEGGATVSRLHIAEALSYRRITIAR